MNDLAVLNPFEQYFSHILGHLEGHYEWPRGMQGV